MLKAMDLMKVAAQSAMDLRQLLEQVPVIERLDIRRHVRAAEHDIVVRADILGKRHVLVCEVKTSGQPRHARMALVQLRDRLGHHGTDATAVLVAPYLSAEVQAMCREQGAGYLDLQGNARLVFGSVFIERQVASKPAVERRALRSLFKPKSAQVLRTMLRGPGRAWRVAELAEAAGVSLGHASNVRAGLLDREWARLSVDGLSLADPDALLNAWRDAYEPPAGKRQGFYTTLHGAALEQAVRNTSPAGGAGGLAALASFSAAQWFAPYGRTGVQYFYADEAGLERLRLVLKLSSPAKGENVVVTVLEDLGVFRDIVEPAPGVMCTSPVQTYLDLAAAGERGLEAAEHLRRERLAWQQ
ncbi:type IV toxin-antitoxin system AbiEi family antitoxin [Cupriavidus sp. CP313]